MAFTEETSVGWFSRIGSSIKGILFGFVLLLASVVILVMNERNAVKDLKTNEEIAEKVVSVSADQVDSANEGKLVHLNGEATTEDVVKNEQFEIEENAIRLSWAAEIYQWVEKKDSKKKKKLGGGEKTVTTYTYKQEWVKEAVDSSGFKEAGHENFGEKKFQSGSSQAKKVTLGAFTLSDALVSQISWSKPYPLEDLPKDWKKKDGRLKGGVFFTGKSGSPKIGDERVTFSLTKPGEATIMAVQTGESFSAFQSDAGKSKLLLYEGLLSAKEVVAGEEKKAKFLRWALRGGGVLAMFLGFMLILKPLSVLADVIPFLGGLVGGVSALISLLLSVAISFVVIAISWIFFRPLLGISLLAVAIGVFVLIKKKMAAKKQVSAAVPPPLN